MTAVAAVADRVRSTVGSRTQEDLGEITRLLIQRYARAVGDDNPLYLDPEYARAQGYEDVIAPPNLLASVVVWGVGLPESELLADGTEHGEDFLRPDDGVRIMGGGEKMRFHKPVVAGSRVTLTSELVDVSTKDGNKGQLMFVVYENTYTDQQGDVLCVCTRTVIVR